LKTTPPFALVDLELYSSCSEAESLSYLSIAIGENQAVLVFHPSTVEREYTFLFSSISASQDRSSKAFDLSTFHLEAVTIASISSRSSFAWEFPL